MTRVSRRRCGNRRKFTQELSPQELSEIKGKIQLSAPIKRIEGEREIRYQVIFYQGIPLIRIANNRPIFKSPNFSEPPWTPQKSQAEHQRIHQKYEERRKALVRAAVDAALKVFRDAEQTGRKK